MEVVIAVHGQSGKDVGCPSTQALTEVAFHDDYVHHLHYRHTHFHTSVLLLLAAAAVLTGGASDAADG